jgi:hypothetical protein
VPKIVGIVVVVAACSSPSVKPSEPRPTNTAPTAAPSAANERRGMLAIDPEPGGKKFQGVWFESGDQRFVLDYRPHGLWTVFAGREVVITGGCYQPFGQAISATHFEVETLRVAEETRGIGPYFSFGPKQRMLGEVVDVEAPPGSKLSGTSQRMFRTDGGETFALAGGDVPDPGKRVRITARQLEPDMSYVARSNGPDLWIHDAADPDAQDDPAHADKPIPCPETVSK